VGGGGLSDKAGIPPQGGNGKAMPEAYFKTGGMEMKTKYWCAISEFYDNGAVKAAITSKDCEKKPRNRQRNLPFADCHMDWFDTEAEARESLAEARLA
jgi:hypothetical protein